MQEAVEQGTIRFAVTTASLSGFALLKGCQAYLEMRRKGKIKHGYMTVDELIKKDQGVSEGPGRLDDRCSKGKDP